MSDLPFIVVGDRTSHGGTVITGSPFSDCEGRAIARIGDKVTCPIKGHGITTIVTGNLTEIIDGSPVARHGDKTACGATLIASQQRTVDSFFGGDVPVAPGPAPQTQFSAGPFKEFFVLRAAKDGTPLKDVFYRIATAGGSQAQGYTDAGGRTAVVWTDQPEDARLSAEPAPKFDDPYHFAEGG